MFTVYWIAFIFNTAPQSQRALFSEICWEGYLVSSCKQLFHFRGFLRLLTFIEKRNSTLCVHVHGLTEICKRYALWQLIHVMLCILKRDYIPFHRKLVKISLLLHNFVSINVRHLSFPRKGQITSRYIFLNLSLRCYNLTV